MRPLGGTSSSGVEHDDESRRWQFLPSGHQDDLPARRCPEVFPRNGHDLESKPSMLMGFGCDLVGLDEVADLWNREGLLEQCYLAGQITPRLLG